MGIREFPNLATLVVAIVLLGLPWFVSTTLAVQIASLALGTLSINFLLGSVGLLSFGQGLFVGVGAYASGILLRDFHLGLLESLVAAGAIGSIVACILGSIVVRRHGVYFVMLTLAFAQMGYFAMLAFKEVTGGENGLMGVPRNLTALGVSMDNPMAMYCLAAGVFFLVFLFAQRVLASPFGSVLASIKVNEARSEALGYPVKRYKAAAFSLAGAMAGLAGGLHVIALGFVSPNNIELEISQRLLVMAVIGGVSSPGGALLGTLFYELMSEVLSSIWPRWLALIALLLVVITIFIPGGLWLVGGRLVRGMRNHARR